MLLNASCESCGAGYDGLALGAGRTTFAERCEVPALCTTCKTVVTADIVAPDPRCPSCSGTVRFYSEQVPAGQPKPSLHWRHPHHEDQFVTLADSGSTCPECGDGTLAFRDVGSFD